MHPFITSHQNPKIKNLLALEKSRERKHQQAFTIEGVRELSLAMAADYALTTVFFCPDIIDPTTVLKIVKHESLLIPVQRSVFEKIAYRESTEGVIAIATQKDHTLDQITLRKNTLVLVLEAVEKPGNLGAMLRTADAANVDAVITCDPQTDFYNPNVVRSSVGCLFTTQTASATLDETMMWLKKNEISIVATSLQASKPYYEIDFRKPTALIMGTESTGLSTIWTERADERVIIPMQGKIDSINVSTAAAVIIFEANRQRGFR